MALLEFLPIVLALTAGFAHAGGQSAAILEKKAMASKWIVYGRVVTGQMSTTPQTGNATADRGYTVRLEPLCWLRRDLRSPIDPNDGPETTDDEGPPAAGDADRPEDTPDGPDMDANTTMADEGLANITVEETEGDGVFNNLTKGSEYILFLERNSPGRYTVSDDNSQSGAKAEPEDEHFEAVHRGIDAGMRGSPDGECRDGVEIPCFVGEVDYSVCDKGVALGVAVWSIVMAAAFAVIGY